MRIKGKAGSSGDFFFFCNLSINNSSVILFFKVYLFILGERERVSKGRAERDKQNPKQDSCCQCRAQ